MGVDTEMLGIIKKRIIQKYGTMRHLAELLGISDATLNNNIKLMSRKFEMKLNSYGIDTTNKDINISESTIINTIEGDNKVVYNKNSASYIELEEENRILKVEVEHLRARVKMFDEMFHFIKDQAEKNKPQP